MTRTNIRTLESYERYEPAEYFRFDPETWEAIGADGSGGVGHYTTQGDRTLWASPRPSKKLGRHRFVLSGTGYYSNDEGGLSWGYDAVEVDLATALSIMHPECLPRFTNEDDVN